MNVHAHIDELKRLQPAAVVWLNRIADQRAREELARILYELLAPRAGVSLLAEEVPVEDGLYWEGDLRAHVEALLKGFGEE